MARLSAVRFSQQQPKSTSTKLIAANAITLSISVPSMQSGTYAIYDLLGRVMQSGKVESLTGSFVIPISALSTGHYFVAIKNELDGEISFVQFVK